MQHNEPWNFITYYYFVESKVSLVEYNTIVLISKSNYHSHHAENKHSFLRASRPVRKQLKMSSSIIMFGPQ